jgi:PAS domain S-box-containing protein
VLRTHVLLRPWVYLPAAMVLAYWAGFFWRIDLSIYDAALPRGPAPTDIVIVAVDDASIEKLGRWPWPRAVHAALLDRLHQAGVRAVALDFLFTEPDLDSPASDVALADALRRDPPTVLPLLPEFSGDGRAPRERLPIPILAQAATGVGHADLEIDSDGIVRSVYLREGPGAPTRTYLAETLLELLPGSQSPPVPGDRHPAVPASPAAWVRDNRILIPFLGPPGHFAQFSYVDVLQGRVPVAALHGQIALVGLTAQAIGDAFATPRSGQSRPMPGVEVMANVLETLRTRSGIRTLPLITTILLGLLPVLIVALGIGRLAPLHALLLVLGMCTLTVLATVLALRLGHCWWAPTASLAAMLVAYPLGSWQRLEATRTFLESEVVRLSHEPFPLVSPPAAAAAGADSADFMQRRIESLREATERLRNVRRLFTDLVYSLPDATILVDANGRIVLVNPAAATLFRFAESSPLEGMPIDEVFGRSTDATGLRFASLAARAPCDEEISLKDARKHLLVRAVPFFNSSRERLGILIDLADITELHEAQREREDTARFLSHDMKSPAASLLGLAQLQRDPERALPPEELSQRLDVLALRMLTLLDIFVALARATSADPAAFETFDLRDAAMDAYDEVWAAAQGRNITINTNARRMPRERRSSPAGPSDHQSAWQRS